MCNFKLQDSAFGPSEDRCSRASSLYRDASWALWTLACSVPHRLTSRKAMELCPSHPHSSNGVFSGSFHPLASSAALAVVKEGLPRCPDRVTYLGGNLWWWWQ